MNENKILHKFLDIIQFKNSYQLQSSGIQPQDMYILERIYFNDAIKIKELTAKYSIPPSTLTGIIDRLETKKYVKRAMASDDRRAVELTVTEAGKRVIEKHITEDTIFSRNLFGFLPAEKKAQLLELLEELLVCVNKEKLFKED